jgi:hypothetical protein
MTVAGESHDSPSLPVRVWRELHRSMSGPLLLPGEDQFESLRMPATSRRQPSMQWRQASVFGLPPTLPSPSQRIWLAP